MAAKISYEENIYNSETMGPFLVNVFPVKLVGGARCRKNGWNVVNWQYKWYTTTVHPVRLNNLDDVVASHI